MKKEITQKNKLWLWLGIALAAVVIVGAVAAMFILPGVRNQDAAGSGRPVLYWNVDGASYIENSEVVGMSSREPDEEGIYHIRFVLDGEQVELMATDSRLVNYIDSMSVMGLEFDADGMIINAVDPKTLATEHAKDYYVRSCDGNTLVVNSSVTMNGMDVSLVLGDTSCIYNVTANAEPVGMTDTVQVMDVVSVYGNEFVGVSHVFITQRTPQVDVYHRVDRYYETITGSTTREPDENGVYTILFAIDGQQVELKCKDKDLVSKIDSGTSASAQMGLIFDDEGYIVDTVVAEKALRGILKCNDFNVTSVDGNNVTVERVQAGRDQGQIRNFTITDDTKIFAIDDGCVFDFVGQSVDALTDMDRVICYTDLDDNAILIGVVKRRVDSPMFYNKSRMFADGHTTRETDANGYYVYEMTAEGRSYTLKTNDKELADKIDGNVYQMMGLALDGNIILDHYDPSCVSGFGQFGQGRYITSVSGAVYRVVSSTDFTSGANYLTSSDCKIYDVTGDFNVPYGSQTTFQLYDQVTGFRNIHGEISHAVVLNRYHEGTKLYYNIKRMYDNKAEKSTREKVDGYYVYEMICEGRAVTVKTSSDVLANVIDKQNQPIVAMKVNSAGIVLEAYTATAAIKYSRKVYNSNYVGSVDADGLIKAYYYKDNVKTWTTVNYKMAKDCKIYNVSTVYNDHRGERTTLRADDRIQAFYDREKQEIVQIFVVERKVDSPLYWHVNRCYNSVKGETTREVDANNDYVFELAVNGTVKTFKTKDKKIANAVDAMSANNAFTLSLKGDTIVGVYSAMAARDVYGQPGGFRDVMVLEGNKAKLVRNRPGAEDYGATTDLVFAKNCQYYDVSFYADDFGAKTTVGLGDRLKVYTNRKGEVIYCFVVNKNVRQEGHVGLCDHCGKEVFWEPFAGTFYQADAHYYLPADRLLKEMSIGSSDETKPKYDIVLDLNGKTLSSEKRNFIVYSTFSVVDPAGGGRIEAMGIAGQGGNMLAIRGGTMNIYGGTITGMPGNEDSKNGGVLFAGTGGTINLYGGTIKDGHVSLNGGCVFIKDGNFNMYGGTISGGTAKGKANSIYTSDAKVNIAGGKIDGVYYVDVDTELNLTGNPVITNTGLAFAEGVKINQVALTAGASVMVSTSGVFTAELSNANSMCKYFVPSTDCAEITVRDNALWCLVKYNEPLVFDSGTELADCAVCGKKVQWTKLTNEATVLKKDGHFYLAEDIVYTGDKSYLSATTQNEERGTICVHLNGHNITATKMVAIYVNKGIWNIMGQGTVSGNRINSNNTVAATIDAVYSAGVVNLYGGTFTKPTTNVNNPVLAQRNGVINLRGDANIVSDSATVRVYVTSKTDTPQFNMLGGEITGGNVYLDSGSFKQSAGTLSSDVTLGKLDVVTSSTDSTIVTCCGTYDLSGGKATGVVNVSSSDTMRLSGNAVVSGCLNVTDGAMIGVDGLSDGASITVFADGAFAQTTQAESVKKFIQPAVQGDSITLDGNKLVYTAQKRQITDDLVFINGTNKARCPLCENVVSWIALDQATHGTAGYGTVKNDGDHLYLTENISYTSDAAAFITAPGGITNTTGKNACLHLNGHNITATKHRAIGGSSGILNVLGTGTVSGNFADAGNLVAGSTVNINNNRITGTINLWSGNYVMAQGNSQKSVVSIGKNGGRIRIYKDATVAGNIDVGVANVTEAEMTIAGTVSGSVNVAPSSMQNGFTTTLNVNGGKILGGAVVGKNNIINLSGAAQFGGTGLDLSSGAKINLDTLTDGAAILVKADGVFTTENDNIADYHAFFTPVSDITKIVIDGKALCCKKDYSGDLKFTDGTNMAVCPACENAVEWTALTATATTLSKGGHYYLANDITYTGTSAYLSGSTTDTGAVCLHLNGHNITAEKHRVISLGKATLNLMGSGTVSGNFSGNTNQGATVYANYYAGVLNHYSGTITKAANNTTNHAITHFNGTVQLFEDACITGGYKIFLSKSSDRPVLRVQGSVIDQLDVLGGDVTLSGTTKISNLVVADGIKVTLGTLADGAAICVDATGVFTQASDKAAEYVQYFNAKDNKSITVVENCLVLQ